VCFTAELRGAEFSSGRRDWSSLVPVFCDPSGLVECHGHGTVRGWGTVYTQCPGPGYSLHPVSGAGVQSTPSVQGRGTVYTQCPGPGYSLHPVSGAGVQSTPSVQGRGTVYADLPFSLLCAIYQYGKTHHCSSSSACGFFPVFLTAIQW